MVFLPESSLRWIRGFSRNLWAGWLLAAVDLIWVGWLTYSTPWPWAWVDLYKSWVIVVVPVLFVLVVLMMDELMAARALGGLLMLVPWPCLDAAFMHPSAWRLVVVTAAYLMAVAGMILTLSPYQLRRAMNAAIRGPAACRAWGIGGVAFGAFVILLAIVVY
jgi:hypothetical protein